jgi:membrane associated rhomboid family serine protease
MFMMPYVSRITRGGFPVGVILLVLINVIVFFGPQAMDERRYARIAEYYAQSVLPAIELPAFARYLRSEGEADQADKIDKMIKYEAWPRALGEMEGHASFMRSLRQSEVIRADHPQYGEWRSARQSYDAQRKHLFTERFHFDTQQPTWLTAFSHQFLHGDTGHLIGNMVVLALIAPAVEALVGTGTFLGLYLLSGIVAAGAHLLFTQGAPGGLVGASGAISGAMGAFAVLLGRRKIPFFYFVFVYFDVIKAPALLALPIWLANELLQFFWLGNGHVAYGAHFGGLVAGAVLAWPLLRRAEARLLPDASADEEQHAREVEHAGLVLKEARRLMTAQRFDEARRAYARAAAQPGLDTQTMRECVNVCKLAPGSEEYHRAAGQAMAQPEIDAVYALEVFRDYLKLAKPLPRLTAETLSGLASRALRLRALPDAERAVRLLHSLAPAYPRLPELFEQIEQALSAAGNVSAARALHALHRRS